MKITQTCLIFLFVIAAVGTAQAAVYIYPSQEACEAETGVTCTFTMCDYIPKGKTFKEVCGDGVGKGYAAKDGSVFGSKKICQKATGRPCRKGSGGGWAVQQ